MLYRYPPWFNELKLTPHSIESVGAALPDDDDLAAELLRDGAKTGLISDEGAVLFGAARDVDGGA